VADLIAKTPLTGLLPFATSDLTCSEVEFAAITSVAPFKRQEGTVSESLKAQIGANFPKPGRTTGRAHARVVWSGRGQALVLGAAVEPIKGAAMTDQTDAWACVALDGPGARDVLARLVPLDLRDGVFARGHATRTLVGHMHAVLMRTGPDRYGIMVFRSMARTLAHELKSAMEAVAARG